MTPPRAVIASSGEGRRRPLPLEEQRVSPRCGNSRGRDRTFYERSDVSKVSKAMRFEVLRRDNFSCRYCGTRASADSPLQVDHVLPIALGGTNEADNLVAACRDCNYGKAKSNPDSDLVAAVSDANLRWRAAVAQASAESLAVDQRVAECLAGIEHAWSGVRAVPMDMPDLVTEWLGMGIPVQTIVKAAWIALQAEHIPASAMPGYMRGICNNKAREIQSRARAIMAEGGAE